MTDYVVLLDFLKCYFQSEDYPTDMSSATEQCFLRYDSQAAWANVLTCAQAEQTLINFARVVLDVQNNYRPLLQRTPHIFLGDDYSALAAVDLHKAVCRVTVSYIALPLITFRCTES